MRSYHYRDWYWVGHPLTPFKGPQTPPRKETPVWPLPSVDGHTPVILSGSTSDELLLGYELDDSLRFTSGRLPVYASKDGVLETLNWSDNELQLEINHGNGLRTRYSGLASHHPILRQTFICPRAVRRGELIADVMPDKNRLVRPLRYRVIGADTESLRHQYFDFDYYMNVRKRVRPVRARAA